MKTLAMRRTFFLLWLSLSLSCWLGAQRVDSSLQSLITAPATVSDLILQDDGHLLVAGNFTFVNGERVDRIVRLRPDGTRTPGFVTTFRDTVVTAMDIQSDGRILVGGYIPATDEEPERGVAFRLQPDGAPDPSFQPALFNRRVLQIKELNQTTIVIGGLFSAHAGLRGSGLVTLFPDGTLRQMITLDPPASPDTTDIYRVVPLPDAGFYVSGNRGFEGVLHRIRPNGVLDTTFQVNTVFDSGDFMTSIQELQVVNGEVWLGTFTWEFNPQVVRLDSTGQLMQQFSVPNPQGLAVLPDGRALVTCVVDGEPDVYIAAEGQLTPYLPGPPADDFVSRMAVAPDGSLFVAGRYSFFKGFPLESIMKFTPSGNPDLSFSARLQRSGVVRQVMQLDDGRLLIAGRFTQVNQREAVHLARLFPNGDLDPTFAVNTLPRPYSVNAITRTPTGQILVATEGRSFDDAPYFPLVRLQDDGQIDPSFSTNLASAVVGDAEGVVAMDNGRILVYGSLSINADIGRYRQLLAFNTAGELDTAFMHRFDLGTIRDVIPAGSGKWLLVGSDIRHDGGDPRAALQIFSSGNLDASFFPEMDANSDVYRATRLPSTKLMLSGRLNGLGNSSSVFRLFPDGRIDRSFAWVPDRPGEVPTSWPRVIVPQAQDSFMISNRPGERDVLYLQMDQNGLQSDAYRIDYPAFTSSMLLPNDSTLLVGGNFVNPVGGSGLMRILLNQNPPLSTSLRDRFVAARLNIFPNPAPDGRFFVQRPTEWQGATRLEIFSLSGQLLEQATIRQPIQEIRLAPKSKGIFMVRLHNGQKTARSLLVVPH